MGNLTSPSSAFVRAETAGQVDAVIQTMDAIDREVLALRHFEHLTNSETAWCWKCRTGGERPYVRALQKLKKILQVMPD